MNIQREVPEQRREPEQGQQLPGVELKGKIFQAEGLEFDLGWVVASLGLTVELKGRGRRGEPGVQISIGPNEVEVSEKIHTALGETELKFSGEPGKLAKLAFEVGGRTLGFEASANADWKKPFALAAKNKFGPGELVFGGWTFDGDIEVSYELNVRPGERLLATAARAAWRAGAEVAGSTAFAVIGTTVVWWGWVAGGLMAAGHASKLGKEEAVGFMFSRGLAATLAALSEAEVRGVDPSLYSVDWSGLVAEAGRAYLEPGATAAAGAAMDYARLAGRARAVQAVGGSFPTEQGRRAWAERLRREMGQDPRARELAYLSDLMDQVEKHQSPQALRIPHLE